MAFLVKSSHPLSYHKIIYPAWKLKICESHIKTFNLNIFTCSSKGITISPTVQYCSSASKYSAAPPLLAADQPAHVFSSRAPALLMAYDAGGGKWVAGCVQNVETRDGTSYVVSRNFWQLCVLHWHQLQTIAIECYLDRRWDRKDLRLSVWLCEPVKYNFYNFKYLSHSLKWADQMRVVESRTLQALCSTGNWRYDGLESRHNE